MSAILVNGEPTHVVEVADRGLAYGDGVFRTMLVRAGRLLNAGRHLRLLARDCAALALPAPAADLVLDEVRRVAPGDAVAKVTVTRGRGGRGYAPSRAEGTTRIVAAFPMPPERAGAAVSGVRVRRCSLVLSVQPRLAGVKSLNRLENVLARAEWEDPGIAEGLLADAAGHLVEGVQTNVFLVRGGRIHTPDLSRCGVQGAQRERVLELAPAHGIACEVREIAFDELAGADEVFLTNSVIGVWPVSALDDRRWVPGPVAREIRRIIEEDDAVRA